jgi:DDE superfamily endonuclease
VLEAVLADYVPTAEDLNEATQYIVDGTLLPCWSWASHPELYSGKHKTTGMNVQVACTLSGHLAWISDPIVGSRHDSYCLNESGLLLTRNPADCLGDKGYVGNDMLTPIKKPLFRDLLDWEKEFNQEINRIRSVIERAIANLKTWRILHTDYRRPLETFPQTISTVIALLFFGAH